MLKFIKVLSIVGLYLYRGSHACSTVYFLQVFLFFLSYVLASRDSSVVDVFRHGSGPGGGSMTCTDVASML